MLVEPLHKWLSNLFHDIMVLFECWDVVESHVISSLLFYFRSGFNNIQRGSYFKYKEYRQQRKSIVSRNGRFQKRRVGELGKEDLPYRIVIIINKVAEIYNGDDDDATSQYLSRAQMAAAL
jgi:hypothetical protein